MGSEEFLKKIKNKSPIEFTQGAQQPGEVQNQEDLDFMLFDDNSGVSEDSDASLFNFADTKKLNSFDYKKVVSDDNSEDNQADSAENESREDGSLMFALKNILSFKQVREEADTDGDGTVSETEAKHYFLNLAKKDGKGDALSVDDVKMMMEEKGITSSGANGADAPKDEKEEKVSDTATEPVAEAPAESETAVQNEDETEADNETGVKSDNTSEEAPKAETDAEGTTTHVQPQNGAQALSQTSAVAPSGGVNGGAAFGAAMRPVVKTINNMTLDELQVEKGKREQKLKEKQNDVNAVHNGTNANVKAAKVKADNAQKVMQTAVAEDKKIKDADKKDLEKVLGDIKQNDDAISDNGIKLNENETAISNKEDEINDSNEQIEGLTQAQNNINSVLSKLNSDIAAVNNDINANRNSKTTQEAKDKAEKKLNDKKAGIEKRVQAKKAELEAKTKALQDEQGKLKNAQKELGNLKNTKTELEKSKKELEDKKAELKDQQDKILKKIKKDCSSATKAKIKAYENARANIEKVRADELKKATAAKSEALKSVKEVNAKIAEVKSRKSKSVSGDVDCNYDLSLTKSQQGQLSAIKGIFEQNRDRYEKVAAATGVPAELVCAIHYRESGCNFSTYLHNGDPLGKPTVHVPRGKMFTDWADAAIDAISSKNTSNVSKDDIGSQLDYAERYNGLGYRKKGKVSPYVWSGTSNYTGGMYVRDGVYSETARDKRVGVAAALKTLYS